MRRGNKPETRTPERSDRNAIVVYLVPRGTGTATYAVAIECADESLRDELTEKAKKMIRSGLV